jgi:hypothetical protein
MGLTWQARAHDHIKYESLTPFPNVEGLDSDSDSAPEYSEQREAKRRRVENYARQYLNGQPLFIASATLKGPFPSGWVNPWRKRRAVPPVRDAITVEEHETKVETLTLQEGVDMEDSANEEEDVAFQHGGERIDNLISSALEKDDTSLDSISEGSGVYPAIVEEGMFPACMRPISPFWPIYGLKVCTSAWSIIFRPESHACSAEVRSFIPIRYIR